MSLILHYHPLSSFCQKVLIALDECEIRFTAKFVNLMDDSESDALRRLWPMRKFPVLTDGERVVAESTTIIEYLALHHGAGALVGRTPQEAATIRAQDRICDWHLELPLQKIVADRLRPAGARDPFGVDEARAQLRAAYRVLEATLADGREWLAATPFSMADCAAAPALFYANMLEPFAASNALAAYAARLEARASVTRVRRAAQPYLANMPA